MAGGKEPHKSLTIHINECNKLLVEENEMESPEKIGTTEKSELLFQKKVLLFTILFVEWELLFSWEVYFHMHSRLPVSYLADMGQTCLVFKILRFGWTHKFAAFLIVQKKDDVFFFLKKKDDVILSPLHFVI